MRTLSAANLFLFVALATHSRAASIPRVAGDLVRQDWSSVRLDHFIDSTSVEGAEKDISAAVEDHHECSPMRVVRFLETVSSGTCTRCMRVEFSPSEDEYVLAALVIDYSFSEYAPAKIFVGNLLRGAGVPDTAVDIPRRAGGRSEWTRSWSIQDEMRSLAISVTRARNVWRVHFDHRRSHVSGVPATPF